MIYREIRSLIGGCIEQPWQQLAVRQTTIITMDELQNVFVQSVTADPMKRSERKFFEIDRYDVHHGQKLPTCCGRLQALDNLPYL